MLTRTIALALLLATSATQALAQPTAPTAAPAGTLAENPDVAAATRLFSAWLEGQIAYRGRRACAQGSCSFAPRETLPAASTASAWTSAPDGTEAGSVVRQSCSP